MVPSVLFIAAFAYSPIHLNVRRLDESAVSAKSMHLPLEELETNAESWLLKRITSCGFLSLSGDGSYTDKKENQIFLIYIRISEWSSCKVIYD
jgi:hypothetical protein